MDKQLIQEQFGANVDYYTTSKPHAVGASLARLIELVAPQADWQALDLATAVGHTALAFAPHVGHVWATDITPEMLQRAKSRAEAAELTNVTVEYADVEAIPYEDDFFDLVTCRIAPHHFSDIGRFLAEAVRVLRPGGVLAVVDNILPGGPTGDYLNAFERLRDPSHGRCLSGDEWQAMFERAGLTVRHRETLDKQLVFESWAGRHDATTQRFLRALLTQAPPQAAAFLQPQTLNDTTTFRLQEVIIVGRAK